MIILNFIRGRETYWFLALHSLADDCFFSYWFWFQGSSCLIEFKDQYVRVLSWSDKWEEVHVATVGSRRFPTGRHSQRIHSSKHRDARERLWITETNADFDMKLKNVGRGDQKTWGGCQTPTWNSMLKCTFQCDALIIVVMCHINRRHQSRSPIAICVTSL